MLNHSGLFGAPVAAVVLALAGCYARAAPPSVDYVETTAAPVDIEGYPSVIYLGQPAYFYGDRWWYREGDGRWAYYRDEPVELHRQREFVLRAPPARARVRRAPRVEEREIRRPEIREESR